MTANAATRIASLADEAPTAEAASRILLAKVCAAGRWAAARLELRNEFERRTLWHLRLRRRLADLRAAAEERRHAPAPLDEGLTSEPWTRVARQNGASFLFPLRTPDGVIGALEAFSLEGTPAESTLALTLAACEEVAPVLTRKPTGVSIAGALDDPLTGLAGRTFFMQRLAAAVERARRSPGTAAALILLDLDRFKVINDSLGHIAGDDLLRSVARRIRNALRPDALAARLGGDEFAVLLERVHDPGSAVRTGDRLRRALGVPFSVGGRDVYVTAGVGVAFGGESCSRAEDLLHQANSAAHQAKSRGLGQQAVFDASMRASAVAQLTLESELRGALDRGQLAVHFQPVVSLEDDDITGFEALARWHHPELGWIPPARFIPAAEEAGLIGPLGNFILREACAGLKLLQMSARRPLSLSVNLSAAQLLDGNLVDEVAQVLGSAGVDPSRVRLEMTESVLVDHLESAVGILERLRGLGAGICIDDFGTGYSSLSYLHRLPVDVLKIDRSFIAALPGGGKVGGIVAAIVTLARNLGLELIAEGVETDEQAVALRREGVTQAQGFRFATALEASQAAAVLRGYAASSMRRTSPGSASGVNGLRMNGKSGASGGGSPG